MTEEEFHSLLQKYINGTCTDKEKSILDDFFDSHKTQIPDIEFPATFEEYKNDASKRIFENIESSISDDKSQGSKKEKSAFKLLSLVTIVLLFISGLVYFQYNEESEAGLIWMKLKTENGQKSSVVLSDGTKVTLNSGSVLIYPEKFGTENREVKLEGEAFFEVKRDESRPFKIKSKEVITQVLGTSFNINTHSFQTISIGVVSGKVKVGDGTNELILTKGVEAKYDLDKKEFNTYEIDIATITSWMKDRIVFENTPLIDALGVLQRWYDVQFVYKDASLGSCKIHADFNNQDLDNVLETLNFIYGIEYEISENQKEIKISKIKCN